MLTAAILLLLVGQVSAVIKCVVGSDGSAAPTDCAAEVTACYTHTVTDSGTGTTTITYGCGDGTGGTAGTDDCDKDTGDCVFCYTERALGCNKKDGPADFECFDSTDNTTKVCVTELTSEMCYEKTKKDDKSVVRGCGNGGAADDAYEVADTCAEAAEPNADGKKFGCNAPDFMCFKDLVGDFASAGAVACDDNKVEKCYTKTTTDNKGVKTVTRDCGECPDATNGKCPADSSTCTSNEINGCNEPERKDFNCVQKDDWQKNDTETKATPCLNKPTDVYTVSSCKTTTTTAEDGTVTVAKACGECAKDAAENVKCLACTTTGCNSATGLFSVLALTLAIIYQLL